MLCIQRERAAIHSHHLSFLSETGRVWAGEGVEKATPGSAGTDPTKAGKCTSTETQGVHRGTLAFHGTTQEEVRF